VSSRSGQPDESGVAFQGVRTRFSKPWRQVVSTFALIFVLLWLLGSISSFTLGGLIHVFLAMAIGLMLPRVLVGRKVTEY
jgi:Family of unknown function (DUF5670)